MQETELKAVIEISGAEVQAIMDCADSAFKQGIAGGLNTAAIVFQFAGKAENALRTEYSKQQAAKTDLADSKKGKEDAKPLDQRSKKRGNND